MVSDIQKLLNEIEQKLDWGPVFSWQNKDFEELGSLILKRTNVSLSVSTLRRVWGRVQYDHLPNTTTLNTLAKFAGYPDWRTFAKQNAVPTKNTIADKPQIAKRSSRHWMVIAAILFGLPGIGLLIFAGFGKNASLPDTTTVNYSFSGKSLSRSIPNTVVFQYDATKAPDDSVFIQQSWSPLTKMRINKKTHEFTSVYYEPGFYMAKLIIGERIVREYPLTISTKGWIGIIGNNPVPVYLDSTQFISPDVLRISTTEIINSNIPLQPRPPIVKAYNIGNFEPLSIRAFTFDVEIKQEYATGAAACQLVKTILITNSMPIVIPTSISGCVSELNLLCINNAVSGKTNDLSAFGVDYQDWVSVSCKGKGENIQVFINQKLAREFVVNPSDPTKIVGLAFIFYGAGAIRKVHLTNNEKTVFESF